MPNLFSASELYDVNGTSVFNALNPKADIVSYANLINSVLGHDGAATGAKALRPELFYTKQLLETIRLGADQYPYFRLAETSPIPDKSQKLQLRRWAPLEAHTVPLVEGIPPKSDKGSVETYEIDTNAYGRFMEFTDRVDLDVIDPVITTYTKEYSIVAVETLDLLARDALLMVAQKDFANQAAGYEDMTLDVGEDGRAIYGPSIEDLRLIVLSMKKSLVRPRLNGKFQVICSPEFVYDLINDPYVEKYMQYNNSTKTMYDTGALVPMFDMEFCESMATPNTNEIIKDNKRAWRFYCVSDYYTDSAMTKSATAVFYRTIDEDGYIYDGDNKVGYIGQAFCSKVDGYVKDSRTNMDASYIPQQDILDITAFNNTRVHCFNNGDTDEYDDAGLNDVYVLDNTGSGNNVGRYKEVGNWQPLKFHHCLVVGKDALIRTGMSGQDNAKMYVKAKGSTGVLDPIDQRQSIGFKINSVGFGSARPEAVHDYICIPSTLNLQ